MNLIELINNLPQIIIYFVPGYIFLGLFCFFTPKKIKEVEHFFIRSIVISYVFVVSSNAICTLMKLDSKYEDSIALVLAVILSFISAKIYSSSIYKSFLCKFVNISGHSSVWEDLFDKNRGAIIKGKFKYNNCIARIHGTVMYYDILDNGDCNIVLWNYTIKTQDLEISETDPLKLLYIKAGEIEGLEVVQGKDKGKEKKKKGSGNSNS